LRIKRYFLENPAEIDRIHWHLSESPSLQPKNRLNRRSRGSAVRLKGLRNPPRHTVTIGAAIMLHSGSWIACMRRNPAAFAYLR
jgi:hypothetical protein